MSRCNRVGLFLCHCGTNISEVVDLAELAEFAGRLDGVTVVRDRPFLCSESGQRQIQEDIAALSLTHVVVAACSPLMHEETFRQTCQAGGLSPFNLQMANIREHVSWVTTDRARATRKCKTLVAAAVRRVGLHHALEVKKIEVAQSVLVVGGGITGLEAALRLAGAGKRVILVERQPSIGGHMAQLDRTFPTLDCAACILVPKMASVGEHRNITLLTCSEVESVSGFVGSFNVRVRSRARYLDESVCNGCGLCAEECPVRDIPSEVDYGMTTRSAVYFPFPHGVPRLPLIDRLHCAYFGAGACRVCEDKCPVSAIRFDQQDRVQDFEVGAILLATGFAPFDPRRATQYGYGRWDNILTSLEFERMCHSAGPTDGRVVLADGRTPESLAILHCVGSRDVRFNRHCSRICCMNSLKIALLARQKTGARVFSFYVDLRATGKSCEEFYEQVQRAGVVFVHGKGAEVIERRGRLLVKAEDTVLGRRVMVPVDMVILAVGLEPAADAAEVARRFNVSCSPEGFLMERHLKLAPVETATAGVYVAGACQGPKDITDSVAHAGAAAANILGLLDRGVVDTVPTVAVVDPARCGSCGLCLGECPYDAIRLVGLGDRAVADVNVALCRSCGTCAASCPAAAITQLGYTRDQLFAELEGLLTPTS
jgi:heterodisulfide reductase subunit A2